MKETRKQIVEQTRNKVAKQYNAKIQNLEDRIARLAKSYEDEQKRRLQLQEKFEDMEEKIRQYEDWNQRLQEFMDMNEEDRGKYIEHMKTKTELNKRMNSMMGTYGKYMSMLFNL